MQKKKGVTIRQGDSFTMISPLIIAFFACEVYRPSSVHAPLEKDISEHGSALINKN